MHKILFCGLLLNCGAMTYHQSDISIYSTFYFNNFPFHQHAISSTCHFINLLFHQHAISSICHFINLPFHQPAISSTCYFINMPFHQLVISSTCHFINWPFHQPAISSICHVINLLFHQLVISSTHTSKFVSLKKCQADETSQHQKFSIFQHIFLTNYTVNGAAKIRETKYEQLNGAFLTFSFIIESTSKKVLQFLCHWNQFTTKTFVLMNKMFIMTTVLLFKQSKILKLSFFCFKIMLY